MPTQSDLRFTFTVGKADFEVLEPPQGRPVRALPPGPRPGLELAYLPTNHAPHILQTPLIEHHIDAYEQILTEESLAPGDQYEIDVESVPKEMAMKQRFAKEQIISMLKEAGPSAKRAELCRKRGTSQATYYITGRQISVA